MKSKCGHALYWHNCYKDSYDLITSESRGHPAKMSPTLGFRILEHLEELGLLKNGDVILDPMGGTGLTNICAGAKGYKSISVELEDPYIEFQKQNKQYAERRLFKPLDWQIIKGDSRGLSILLSKKGLVSVTSPPYVNGIHKVTGINLDKFDDPLRVGKCENSQVTSEGYGNTEGQIGNLKDTQLKVVTSPPYVEAVNAGKGGIDWEKAGRPDRLPENEPAPSVQGTREWRYSEDKENIGNLPDKPLISLMSPPYGDTEKRDRRIEPSNEKEEPFHRGDQSISAGYQATANNIGILPDKIGQEKGETYLSAMLKVYQEIAKVSDTIAVVIKNPTRDKKLRRLDLDTIKLLGMAGWNIHCQHRALLFEELEQATLFGKKIIKVKGRMSFFRRLSWKKGEPVASWEDIIIAKRGE